MAEYDSGLRQSMELPEPDPARERSAAFARGGRACYLLAPYPERTPAPLCLDGNGKDLTWKRF